MDSLGPFQWRLGFDRLVRPLRLQRLRTPGRTNHGYVQFRQR